jgi:hypothetical protein
MTTVKRKRTLAEACLSQALAADRHVTGRIENGKYHGLIAFANVAEPVAVNEEPFLTLSRHVLVRRGISPTDATSRHEGGQRIRYGLSKPSHRFGACGPIQSLGLVGLRGEHSVSFRGRLLRQAMRQSAGLAPEGRFPT